MAFNFSHNGTTPEQPADFADLEAFGHNNYTKELDDLGMVIGHVCGGGLFPPGKADTGRIYLLGHSQGEVMSS